VFADREDCFLAAFDQGLEQARSLATDAYARESGWLDGMRAALARVLRLMDAEPGLARLCVVEALGAGEHVLERRAQALRDVVAAIDRGRSVANASGDPSELTAEGVLGAITAVLHARLRGSAGRGSLTDLLGPLMSMIALPYLGADAAASELSRPPLEHEAHARPSTRPAPADPLKGLNMRLTYRTVRVLTVISEHPGASNREIGERSGIADPGQISKLLTRLARLELIENAGEGQERGAANAWHLSTRGAQIERATRPR
jgi:AcrR family transcriptional regulator